MLAIFSVCLIVFTILVVAEFGAREGWLKNEFGRKFVHITVGSFVAFWPLLLDWTQIIILSLAFIAVIAVSKWLRLFSAIHSVQRPTWGEIYFALTVGVLAFVTQDGWIYMAALLHMSLADGLAAIVGLRYGGRNRYSIFGHMKSLAGTLTFLIVSLGILVGYMIGADTQLAWPLIAGVAVGAAILENISARGLDNLTVPMWVALILVLFG